MADLHGRQCERTPLVSDMAHSPHRPGTAVGRRVLLPARFPVCASLTRPWPSVCSPQSPLVEPYVRFSRIRLSDGLSVTGIRLLTQFPSQSGEFRVAAQIFPTAPLSRRRCFHQSAHLSAHGNTTKVPPLRSRWLCCPSFFATMGESDPRPRPLTNFGQALYGGVGSPYASS